MPRPGQKYILRVALPFREHAQRFGLAALFSLSIGLIVLGRTDFVPIERFRASVSDIVIPILSVLSQPVETVRGFARDIRYFIVLHEENKQLREINTRLQRWEVVAHTLERENTALRALLEYKPGPAASYISARVVGGSAGPFVRVLMLNAGILDGVRKGQPVLDNTGMVGRVVEVGKRSARVLLLTDLNSRIPIVLEKTGDRAILAGNNSELLDVELLSPKSNVLVGMRVSTSGHGGKLPARLPIGRVSVVQDGVVQVQPFVDFNRLEYVLVVDWEPLQFVPASESNTKLNNATSTDQLAVDIDQKNDRQ